MTVSVRRALVDCVVLSVQDTAVFYPCCKGCFCRITIDQRHRLKKTVIQEGGGHDEAQA